MKIGKYTYVAVVLGILCMVYLAIFGVGPIKGVADIRFGIDIRGGVEAIFQPRDYAEKPTVADLDAARVIIEGRLDAMNILDREVTVDQGGGYILVRFPWKSGETEFNPEAAISELGEMAKLTFRDEKGQVLLEGKNVVASHASVDQNGFPAVSLEFDSIGNRLFGEATAANVGRVISIYMDETLLSAANVDEAIYGGKAIITGKFTAEYTKSLAEKINSGALPFALETKSFSTISPSLAQESLRVMVAAGLLSLLCICLFMCCRYKLAGVVSFLALLLQISVQLLTVSMSQLTLTLPGIAGIILSIGMGVDANIIISERIGDELREKTTIRLAIKTGYKNAFHAVFDGNITTMIVAVLLIIFGSSTMLSFGYTLGIGLVMNFVAGVAATHIMLN
ncbi:MAG: SecD/SecF family protein translocase subunit, partial [Clostridiales bacterium]